MKKRVADIIIELLVEEGIVDCFAVVGGGAMYLDNALALNDGINKYFNHHEQACAMAAEAYARISGKMAAVCVTSGPGATNAITGVMGAWQDSLPMIVLSGQVRYAISVEKSGLPLRYRGMQEFEIIPSVKNMTKYAKMITNPLEIKREVKKAIHIALEGRRGPVWLDIPQDIQSAMVEETDLLHSLEFEEKECFTKEDFTSIMDSLRESKRPCILAGNGIANSGNIEAFRKFASTLGIPVIAAAIAADVMPRSHKNYYGLSGSIGPRTGNFIVQNADTILSLGCSLGFKMTGFAQEYFAPKAKIISVDVDAYEMKKPGVHVERFIQCGLKEFFKKANQWGYKVEVSKSWIEYCDKLEQRFSPFEPGENLAPEERVCSYYFWKEYEQQEPDDSISVLGNNTANSAKLQIGIHKEKQRIVANNNCGSMGADLPEAFGAAIASKKMVVCLTGDGSIMMNLQELQTIRHHNLPIKLVVFSNDGYNAFRQTAKNFFDSKYIGCTAESGVSFPQFEDVAKTFGFSYKCCNNNQEVRESLQWLFKNESLALLEVKQRLDDPVSPKVMSRVMKDGSFSTPALQDMFPFLEKDEYDGLMLW
ncbi:MAG: thiamine pyrophosphate-binding protein [Lachnospiraceae bacterium]